MKYASSVIKVVGKPAHFAAEIGKLGHRLEAGTLISPDTFRNNVTRQGYPYFLKLRATHLRNLLQGISGVAVDIDAIIAAHPATAGQLTSRDAALKRRHIQFCVRAIVSQPFLGLGERCQIAFAQCLTPATLLPSPPDPTFAGFSAVSSPGLSL